VSLQNRFKSLHYNSPVILTMTLLSLGALILQNITRGYTTSLLFSVYRSSPFSIFFYFRLFGHVLGHANWEHYMNNFLLILLLGLCLKKNTAPRELLL